MAPDVERSVKCAAKSTLLTMDVIELTLLLKSIGFRLESIDFDEYRSWSKKTSENGTGNATSNSGRADADHNYIHVEISCSKSKIVSNLSLKLNDNETAASDSQISAAATSPSKSIACSCPKRETCNASNSFWEVQSSGTFANQRRSINALMNTETGIDHDTSSNLLPVLSTKSIALTHVLIQVLLNQYKYNTQFGESNAAKDVDIKSIIQSLESTNVIPRMGNEKTATTQLDDLNLITPMSSMNVTPVEQEAGLLNVTMPKVVVSDPTAAFNETINTEAFGSPKSDLFTSSPHSNETVGLTNERDVYLINHLTTARQSIEQALRSMKLNVTRSLTQDVLLSTTAQELPDDGNRSRFAVPQLPRLSNGHNATQVSANARTSISAMNRRASIGSIGLGRGVAAKSVIAPAVTSRLGSSRPSSVDRAVPATSKLSLVRRAVTGISNRKLSLGSITSSVKTPAQANVGAVVKKPSFVSRRSSPAMVLNNGTPPTNASAVRKTGTNTPRKTLLPAKIAKK